jgi:hypothetical protein
MVKGEVISLEGLDTRAAEEWEAPARLKRGKK